MAYFPLTRCIEGIDTSGFPGPEFGESRILRPASRHIIRARHIMKKDEEQKALFEIWLAAYNNRLVQVCQGGSTSKPGVEEPTRGEKDYEPEPPKEV
jgi:hypothetical protein